MLEESQLKLLSVVHLISFNGYNNCSEMTFEDVSALAEVLLQVKTLERFKLYLFT